jgi:hypothetical protein
METSSGRAAIGELRIDFSLCGSGLDTGHWSGFRTGLKPQRQTYSQMFPGDSVILFAMLRGLVEEKPTFISSRHAVVPADSWGSTLDKTVGISFKRHGCTDHPRCVAWWEHRRHVHTLSSCWGAGILVSANTQGSNLGKAVGVSFKRQLLSPDSGVVLAAGFFLSRRTTPLPSGLRMSRDRSLVPSLQINFIQIHPYADLQVSVARFLGALMALHPIPSKGKSLAQVSHSCWPHTLLSLDS